LDITISPLLDDSYIRNLYAGKRYNLPSILKAYLQRVLSLVKTRQYDLLWIEKELLPWLPAWWEKAIAKRETPYLVDYDDAVFHRYDMFPNPVIRFALGKKIDAVMRHANLILAGNEYLATRARRAGAKEVVIFPSVVDIERYQIANNQHLGEFIIGWVGAPVTSPYIHIIQSALAEICKEGDARLILLGSGPIELKDVPVEIHPWTETSEVEEIQNFDVGIMPLPDQPFERGKCGYKLIQYMGCGVPVVASPIGVNQHIVEQGVNGFHAKTIPDWIAALSTLRADPDLRSRMGKAGRAKVEGEFSLQKYAPRLLSIMQGFAGKR
jgi:glycosyltransferase involved in cell wall biosynthesis